MSLSDAQWARIEPLLPDRTPRRGGRWRDHRQVIDAIAFKYRTGIPWMDLPEHFGSWKGVHNRLRKWASDGTWKRVFTNLLSQADAEGDSAVVAGAVHLPGKVGGAASIQRPRSSAPAPVMRRAVCRARSHQCVRRRGPGGVVTGMGGRRPRVRWGR
ncbi:transposase [Streptomyces anulatus]